MEAVRVESTTARKAGGWGLFALVVSVAMYFFGFVAFIVLCAVSSVALINAGWSSSRPWVRGVLWIVAAALLALPVLTFWEAAGSYQVTTVS